MTIYKKFEVFKNWENSLIAEYFMVRGLKLEDFLGLFIYTKYLNDFPLFSSLNNNEKKF